MNDKKWRLKTWQGIVLVFGGLFTGLLFCVPSPLFDVPYSTLVESENGKLLCARIAADEQWRFPALDSVPEKYEKCVLLFEDRYFYRHAGINPVSLTRALGQNIREKKIVSGGSTITMQVCRIARGNKKRSVSNKLVEMVWALNLELRFSKKEILNMYASHAPFGGNVVGLDAAAWRYFSLPASELSWAGAATLAVLPNAPALMFPGRSGNLLKAKRDRLLVKLCEMGQIDSLTLKLSLAEPVPEGPKPLPFLAQHLVDKAAAEKKGKRLKSTLDYYLQEELSGLVAGYQKTLQANHIYNAAVLVTEISSKKVKAYIGNVYDGVQASHENHVDILQAPRSTGSILKPLLYCKMMDEGLLTPQMLIPDIPTRFGGFTPVNFDRRYNGAVPAAQALARSLNIPAVKMLQQYGVAPFYRFLKNTGMKTLARPPDYYGLSLILGGAEVTPWDLSGMYTSLAALLKHYNEYDGAYPANPFAELQWYEKQQSLPALRNSQPVVRAAAVYSMLDAMLQVERPDTETGWEWFSSSQKIAWKTGTSFGFRDAWAVGISGNYVVTVWVGNADGEGRQGLTGIEAAAPLLFDVFRRLPPAEWFDMPADEMNEISVCRETGFRPGIHCTATQTVWVPAGTRVDVCPWHMQIHLSADGAFRVTGKCYPVLQMNHRKMLVLPPAMEYYYKSRNPQYMQLPPLMPGCENDMLAMEFIYPRQWEQVFIPTSLDGTPGQVIFELVHRQPDVTIFWHLDKNYLGKTSGIHQFALSPDKGWHTVNVTDNNGNRVSKRFLVIDNKPTDFY